MFFSLQSKPHLTLRYQICVCLSTALFSGVCFGLWYRLLAWRRRGVEVDGDKTWNMLGRFCAVLCAGSLTNIIQLACSILQYRAFYDDYLDVDEPTERQYLESSSAYSRFYAVKEFFYSLQLSCYIACCFMLLLRVSDHASHSYYNQARDHFRTTENGTFDFRDCIGQYRLYYMVRRLNQLALASCVCFIAVRIAAMTFQVRAADLLEQAATLCGTQGEATSASDVAFEQAQDAQAKGNRIESAQFLMQAAAFLLAFASFILFCPACIIMFRRVEKKVVSYIREMDLRPDNGIVFLPREFSSQSETGAVGDQIEMPAGQARQVLGALQAAADAQKKRYLLCFAVMLLALLTQSTVSLLYSIIQSQGAEENLTFKACDSCQSVEYLYLVILDSIPEFKILVDCVGLTLPLLFCLWLMTTKGDRALLMHPHKFISNETPVQHDAAQDEQWLQGQRLRMGIDFK